MDGKDEQKPLEPESLEPTPQDLNALSQLSKQDAERTPEQRGSGNGASSGTTKRPNVLKRFWNMFNVYLLIFFLLVVVATIVTVVSYLNSQKEPELPSSALQDLTQEELSEIASGGDASVGDPRYILNIQSDAVFAGNALIRGDLSVAGSVQMGQGLSIPSLTVSGSSNLQAVQANSLSVAGQATLQGDTRINGQLTVARASTFGGAITAPQITTGSLVLGGSGSLTLNNHLVLGGATPGRTGGSALGAGGTSSVSGNDSAGTVTINTGNNPPAGCFVTLDFIQNFNGTPKVQITPASSAAGRISYYVQRSSGSFSICQADASASGQNIVFDYFIVN